MLKDVSDDAAVQALSLVGIRWLTERGVEAHVCVNHATRVAQNSELDLPSWAASSPEVSPESASFARAMLSGLLDGTDDEVATWAKDAIRTSSESAGQMFDPLSLAIGGAILIGSILAARVRRVGSVEFYEGVPEELGSVLKEAASVVVPRNPLG